MDNESVERARLVVFSPRGQRKKELVLQFNPSQLSGSLSNSLASKRGQQYVAQRSATLNLELVMDSTESGVDVQLATREFARLCQPVNQEDEPAAGTGQQVFLRRVLLEWGSIRYAGQLSGVEETLDYFSPSGVPLRATLRLTLAPWDSVLEELDDELQAPAPAPPRGRRRRQAPPAQPPPPEVLDLGALLRTGQPQAAGAPELIGGRVYQRFLDFEPARQPLGRLSHRISFDAKEGR